MSDRGGAPTRTGVALAFVLLLLAGCQSLPGASTPTQSTRFPVTESLAERIGGDLPTPFFEDVPEAGPYRTFEVGRDPTVGDVEPVTVVLWNDAETERTLRVRVAAGPENVTALERDLSLSAGEAVQFELRRPTRYRVRVDGDEASHTTVLTDEDFDCNERAVWLRAYGNGTVAERLVATERGCVTVSG